MACAADPGESLAGDAAPAVIIDRLTVAFGARRLFDDFSLRLDGGRTTCLLGPSGCGKSTLLKCIAGSGPPFSGGSIELDPARAKMAVAWMGQDDLLLPWLPLLDNILLGARLRGELNDSLRQRASALLDRAGLGGHGQDLPGRLSGGMRQRGALLRTLMEGRAIVLMDEPFSALDALNRQRLQDLAAGMIKGRTVLLVTHDPLEALRLADRVVVLSGRPVRVAASFEPPGRPPRSPGQPEIARLYTELLAMLMDGENP
ncbi:MAG: ATP-binding cassette domain-containing protein [Desulforhopalus sp.]|nr:ATP-binding cassette domain-containing protein [Desulforhopalus sp.]